MNMLFEQISKKMYYPFYNYEYYFNCKVIELVSIVLDMGLKYVPQCLSL